jgi:hypothetical protein
VEPPFLNPCLLEFAKMVSGHVSCSLQQASVCENIPKSSSESAMSPRPHHFVPATIISSVMTDEIDVMRISPGTMSVDKEIPNSRLDM